LETGLPPALGSKNPWLSENLEQDSTRALQVLQDLGERKAQKLAELKPGPGLGPQILQLCDWLAILSAIHLGSLVDDCSTMG